MAEHRELDAERHWFSSAPTIALIASVNAGVCRALA
jgi:hypothetical protein